MREPNQVNFIEFVKDEVILANDLLFSKSAIDQYYEVLSKASKQNRNHKRNKLTTYITIQDNSKIAKPELHVASKKKHLPDKCKSIMKKPLNSTVKILKNGKFLYGFPKPMAERS